MILHPIKTASFLILIGLMSLSQPTFAGETQDQIKVCRAALESSKNDLISNGNDDIKFRFKSISGAVLKKLKFVAKTDSKRVLIICYIKRKKVRKLTHKNGKIIGNFYSEN